MKISIITPTFNSEKTVSDTIESVFSQTHKDIEYIVIDGVSSDKTLEIISSYQQKFNIRLLSEKDSGLYDAMNKGVLLASGDIVGIINSDDFYYSNNILEKINKVFESDSSIQAVYGDILYIDNDDKEKETRYWKSGEYNEKKLRSGWAIPHPSLFVKREVYNSLEKIFDTRLRLAADYELILRLLMIKRIKVHYLPEIIVKMRDGGASASSLKQRMKGWKELCQAWRINGLRPPFLFIPRRVLGKIGQYILKKKD